METLEIELGEEISDYERERGKPMPTFEHSFTQRKLIYAIEFSGKYLAMPELSLDLYGYKPIPDIAVFPITMYNELLAFGASKISIIPLLTVEILSPHQSLRDLFDKSQKFLKHGVDEAWVIVPEIKSITVFRTNEEPKTFITGDVRQESTGITVNIEQLFSL